MVRFLRLSRGYWIAILIGLVLSVSILPEISPQEVSARPKQHSAKKGGKPSKGRAAKENSRSKGRHEARNNRRTKNQVASKEKQRRGRDHRSAERSRGRGRDRGDRYAGRYRGRDRSRGRDRYAGRYRGRGRDRYAGHYRGHSRRHGRNRYASRYRHHGRRGRAVVVAAAVPRSTTRALRTPPRVQIPNERVIEIQRALQRSGYYQGEITGEYDSATRSAMSSYQRANGLKDTGMPTAQALAKLGLTQHKSPAGDTSAPPMSDLPKNPPNFNTERPEEK